MGCQQSLPLSVVQLKGKHCRKPHCRNGVVDMFGLKALGAASCGDRLFAAWPNTFTVWAPLGSLCARCPSVNKVSGGCCSWPASAKRRFTTTTTALPLWLELWNLSQKLCLLLLCNASFGSKMKDKLGLELTILFILVQGLHTTLDSKENYSRSYPLDGAAPLGNMVSFYGLVDRIY